MKPEEMSWAAFLEWRIIVLLHTLLPNLVERYMDWRVRQIDRTSPRFKYTCSACGQATADEARTVITFDGKLARHESTCLSCELEARE